MSRILIENKDNIQVLTDVNLAMLLRVLNNRNGITVDKLIDI